MTVTSVLACVCNGRLVYGHAGEAPALPLLFIVPAVLLAIGVGVWLAVRRGAPAPRPAGSGPVPSEPADTPVSRPSPLAGSRRGI